MKLNTDHFNRCIETLEQSLNFLNQQEPDSLEFEIFRNATIKSYELTLEIAGKLLKKALKPYFSNSKNVDQLVFKDIFRHAAKHSLLDTEEIKRWFAYRDNNTAHDYGIGFAEQTLTLLPQFVADAKRLYNTA